MESNNANKLDKGKMLELSCPKIAKREDTDLHCAGCTSISLNKAKKKKTIAHDEVKWCGLDTTKSPSINGNQNNGEKKYKGGN